MFIIKDSNNNFIGYDKFNRPTAVRKQELATTFKTKIAAKNHTKYLPPDLRLYQWYICEIENPYEEKKAWVEFDNSIFLNSQIPTPLEDESFDIFSFFSQVINVMAYIDEFIENMQTKEEITDMKILDIRHYIRDNDHKLSAIQMQRLGYYMRELEKERYDYKSKRLIAETFTKDIKELKDHNNIKKMNDILTSKYKPRILGDNEIERIINTKKEKSLDFPLITNNTG